MAKKKVLVLTDHSGHSSENSLYALLRAMVKHPLVASVHVASRGLVQNEDFFAYREKTKIWAAPVEESFSFSESGDAFQEQLSEHQVQKFELVWLRLPPPLTSTTVDFFNQAFAEQIVINRPSGILETGSKAFLLRFPEICPPMRIIKTKTELLAFADLFPIVLKPFREYGGKGIIRIDGSTVWNGSEQLNLPDWLDQIPDSGLEYLGVKFLKQVSQGDKRVVVVNGEIMGASLRLPAKGHWLCNVAMGGSSHLTEVAPEEYEMVDLINPVLSKLGIVMYGLDTLVNDDGKRVLSEINTTSIGGIAQIAAMLQLPQVERTVDQIWQYVQNNQT